MSGHLSRIVRLEHIIRPSGCVGRGRTCHHVVVAGDGSLEPPSPAMPATCPRCGRPVRALIVKVIGVDASLI